MLDYRALFIFLGADEWDSIFVDDCGINESSGQTFKFVIETTWRELYKMVENYQLSRRLFKIELIELMKDTPSVIPL